MNHESVGSTAGNTFVGAIQQPSSLGAAAAGRGYRVNTWDLGALDNSNSASSGGVSYQQITPGRHAQSKYIKPCLKNIW